MQKTKPEEKILKATACLIGQFAGDALGSFVETYTPEQIQKEYPKGLKNLIGGIACMETNWSHYMYPGQLTDDGEMAIILANTLIEEKGFNAKALHKNYLNWLYTDPIGLGRTVPAALKGDVSDYSLSNGALMRISPLGIYCHNKQKLINKYTIKEANITHLNKIPIEINKLFVKAIATAINENITKEKLYENIVKWSEEENVDEEIKNVILISKTQRPEYNDKKRCFALTTFHNALYQLNNASNFEQAIIDSVHQGGDTDTNAAVAGALIGALEGMENIPQQWIETLENCEKNTKKEVLRPQAYLPTKFREIAKQLVIGE